MDRNLRVLRVKENLRVQIIQFGLSASLKNNTFISAQVGVEVVFVITNFGFAQGTGFEMYTETLSPTFMGMTFAQTAE